MTFSEMIQWELENEQRATLPLGEEDDTSSTGMARSIRHRVQSLARNQQGAASGCAAA